MMQCNSMKRGNENDDIEVHVAANCAMKMDVEKKVRLNESMGYQVEKETN